MIRSEKQRKNQRWTIRGLIVVCILAVLFAMTSVFALKKMQSNILRIYKHPYTVSSASREMSSLLLDLKIYSRTILTDGYEGKEETIELLERRYVREDSLVEVVKASYLGPEEDIEALDTELKKLRDIQYAAILYTDEGHSKEEISRFLESYVYDQFEVVGNVLTKMTDYADACVKNLERESGKTASIASAASILLAVLIVIVTIYWYIREKKNSQEIAFRENLFDLLSTSTDEVYIIYDLAIGRFEYITTNAERILEIPTSEFIKNPNTILSYLAEEEAQKILELFANGPLHVQAKCQFQMVKKGGEPCWMQLQIYPIKVKNKVARYIVNISDQTETITINRTLKEALINAQNANEAKRDFLSRMSHEIRTPMNAIIGMTTIAATYIDDRKRVEDCISKINYSSKHLMLLINDILDMSKIEKEKLVLSEEPFELGRLIESITSIIYPQAVEHNQNFHVSLVKVTEELLVGDSLRLNQILLNLLSNSLKFTPAGGDIRLEITQVRIKNNHVRLRFTVSDTGVGMNEEFLERLFTPFEQERSDVAKTYGGTGLGMSITRNLVTLMGGTIDVKSKPGEGSSFAVELPFTLLENKQGNQNQYQFDKMKVLVVDDDPATCEHTTILLDKLGVLAEWVLSGREAVEKVVTAYETGDDYDVCLIDWQMPHMDGVETTRRIREKVGPDTLLIIISAYDWSVIEESARAAGANAFIAKPIFASSLYNTLVAVTNTATISSKTDKKKTHNFSENRILLVEDNELNREIAVELLGITQASIECAENGKEAVDMFEASEPGTYDVILMDIQMPIMNGYQATKAIRASLHPEAETIPIFAMTANAFSEDISGAKAAGMNGHIAKPIDVEAMYEVLAPYMKKR